MRKTIHWTWLIIGILTVACGVMAICWPGATLLTLSWFIGIVLLLEGVCSVVLYGYIGWQIPGSGWYLFDGIVTVIFAGFLLCNQLLTASMLPYLLGMWVIVMGVERIMRSIEAKRWGDKEWWCVLILGILSVCLGVVFLFFPQLSTVAIGVITGIFLILYGGSIIFLWIGDHRARRFLDQMFPDIPEVDAKDVTDEKKNQH